MTPDERLVEAVLASNDAVVADLISQGADLNAQDLSGRTPVSLAAETGAVGCLRVLLGAGGSPDVGDVKGDSAVSYAASTGMDECLQLLLDAGGDRDKVGDAGRSALMRAVLGGHQRCVRTLVSRAGSCDVNAADDDGVTPLAAAVALDHDDALPIVVVLLDAGADPRRADVRGVVPTQLAAAGGKIDILTTLLAKGAGVNDGSVFSTPLHDAAFMGKVKCLRVLLENGADVSTRDGDGRTAMDRAKEAGDYDACVKLLVEHGAADFTVLQ